MSCQLLCVVLSPQLLPQIRRVGLRGNLASPICMQAVRNAIRVVRQQRAGLAAEADSDGEAESEAAAYLVGVD